LRLARASGDDATIVRVLDDVSFPLNRSPSDSINPC
jgi:hypothetical protein